MGRFFCDKQATFVYDRYIGCVSNYSCANRRNATDKPDDGPGSEQGRDE